MCVDGETKMGGGTERALNKLLGYLSDEPQTIVWPVREEHFEQNQGAPRPTNYRPS